MQNSQHDNDSDSKIINEEEETMETKRLKWREYYRSNSVKLNEYRKKLGDKAIKSKKYYCEPCDIALTSSLSLSRHKLSKKHCNKIKHKLSDEELIKLNIKQRQQKKRYVDQIKMNKEKKSFHCKSCSKIFATKQSITAHVTTKKHLSKQKM